MSEPASTTFFSAELSNMENTDCTIDKDDPKITAQRARELYLMAGKRLQMWEFTVENANDPVIVTTTTLDLPGPSIVYVNRAFTQVTGFTSEEVIGLTPRILQGPLTNLAEMQRMREALEVGHSFVGETINYTKAGQPYFMEWSVYALHDEANQPSYYVAIQRDVSARKQYERQIEEQARQLAEANRHLAEANERLAKLALTDSLTEIYNHRAFHETLENEMVQANRDQTPLSLLLLDIDQFKSYNDVYGHPAGDEALRILARLLRENQRKHDIVARHGGEEFAVLLPQTNHADALRQAEVLRKAIEAFAWPLRCITISVGVATLLDFSCECAVKAGRDLVSSADQALYSAKKRGRNCVVSICTTE